MPRLTTAQLNKKLEEARRAGYSEEQIRQVVQMGKQKGLLEEDTFGQKVGRVARDVVEPFEKFGRSAMALGAAGTGLVQGLGGDMEAARRSAQKGYEMLLPDQQEAFTGTADDAALEGLKTGAGLAPFGLPAGQSLKAATGFGALGGAGRGFYETEKDQTIEEQLGTIGKGALGGAAGGASFYGLGKVAQAIRGKGGKLQQPVEIKGTALADDPFYGSNVDQLQRVANDLGVDRTMTPRQQVDTLKAGFDADEKAINKLLKEADVLNEDDILESFTRFLDDTDFDATRSKTYSGYLNNMLKKLDKAKGDPVKLNALKREVQKTFIGKSDAVIANSPKLQANQALRDSLVEQLDNVTPEITSLRTRQRDIYNIAQELSKKAKMDNPIRVEVPFISPGGFRSTGVGADLPVKGGTLKTLLPKMRAGAYSPIGAEAPTGISQAVGQPVMAQLGSQAFTGSLGEAARGPQIDVQGLDEEYEVGRMGEEAQAQPEVPQMPQQQVPQMPQAGPDIFGGKSRQEVLQLAAQKGASLQDLQQVASYYDMLAPQQAGGLNLVQQAVSQGVGKQQFLQAAAAQGADMTKLQEFADAYDMLAPAEGSGMKQQALTSALQLQKMDPEMLSGFSGTLAKIGTLGGAIPSKYGDMVAQFENLKALLSIENRQAMKGSGTISDFEAQLLQDAATTLRPGMTDLAFKKELRKVIDTLSGDYTDEQLRAKYAGTQ